MSLQVRKRNSPGKTFDTLGIANLYCEILGRMAWLIQTVVSIQSVLGPQNTNIYHIRDWWLRPRVKGHIKSFNMLFILNP